jgi:DNA-binding PadR family transcriptional regulator
MMKGFLSFIVLWSVRKEPKTGMEIAKELEERRGHMPSPGTIYPVLKMMTMRGLLKMDKEKRYSLTDQGKDELERSLDMFFSMFFDIEEMKEECRCSRYHEHHGNGDCPCGGE